LDYFLARYYSSAQGRFISPDEFEGGPEEFYYFAETAAVNPTLYADLTDPQSLNKYQYACNSPLLYIDPSGHQGIREHFRDAARTAADFGDGLLRGTAASISFGLFPGTTPKPSDSLVNRLGQGVGTVLVGTAGVELFASGAAVTVLSDGTAAPASVPVALAGVFTTAGATVNAVRIVTTPIHNKQSDDSTITQDSGSQKQKRPATAREVTPSTDPKVFEPVKGTAAKRNKATGEIWVWDRLHKDHYEVYKNQKKFEKGKRRRSVWSDGRLKEEF
jgi:hypothetical protein